MLRRLSIATLVLLFVMLLLVSQWPTRGFWYDETVDAYFASQSWRAIWTWCTTIDNQMPLHITVLKVWSSFGGNSEYVFRVVSVWAGLLSVAALMALGRQLAGRWSAGWIAGGAFALTQGFLYAAFEVRPYALALALYGWSAWFVWVLWSRYAREKRPLDRRYFRMLWGAVVLSLALLYTHYTAVLALGVIALPLIWSMVRRPTVRKLTIATHLAVGIVAGYLPWLLALAGRDIRAGTAYSDRVAPYAAVETYLRFLVHGQRIVPDNAPPYVILVVVVGVLAVLVGWGGRARQGVSLALLGIVMPLVALTFLVYAVQAKLSGRHGWMVWPALALLVGTGLSVLEGERWLRWPVWGAAWLVLWLPAQAALQPIYNSYLREAFAYVEAHAEAGDVLVLRDGTLFTAAGYYRASLPWIGLPPDPITDVRRFLFFDEAVTALQRLVVEHDARRVWVVSWQGQIMDPQNLVEGILEAVGESEPLPEAFGFGDVSLARYRLRGMPEEISFRVRALTAQVQIPDGGPFYLGGYALTVGSVPRGGVVRGHTWWMRGSTVQSGVRVSMRLYDETGAFYAQLDQPPVSASFGQENWIEGEPVLSRFSLIVPPEMPSGPAAIKMILYDMAGSFEPIEILIDRFEVAG